MPIESGRYIITHTQYCNLAFLSDANDGTSLLGCLEQDAPGEEWNVKELQNGRYSIVNFGHKMHASVDFHSKKGDHVVGRETDWLWLITELDSGKYTISTANNKLRWFLEDSWTRTPITLNDAPPSDSRCHWTFQKISRVKAKEQAREQKETFRSYFDMMSRRHFGRYTIKNILDNKQLRPLQISLFWAAEMGHDVAVRLILAQEGVDVNCKLTTGESPLYMAARNGHDAVVCLLLAQEGVDTNSKVTIGATPLYTASQKGNDAVVRLLLAHEGVDVNSRMDGGWTPLYVAAQNGHDAVVRLLLAHEGVDVNSSIDIGWTPLHIAAEKGDDAVIRLLLAQEGVDVNAMNDDGETPLESAKSAKKGNHEIVARLLREKVEEMRDATKEETAKDSRRARRFPLPRTSTSANASR